MLLPYFLYTIYIQSISYIHIIAFLKSESFTVNPSRLGNIFIFLDTLWHKKIGDVML